MPSPRSIGRFLLLEDNPHQQRALSLRIEQYRPVDPATSVSEARVLLARGAPYIGYVFDVYLPDGNGLRFLEQVRRTYDRRTPALIITGQEISRRMSARIRRVGRCLPKPGTEISVHDFLDGLARFCSEGLRYERDTFGPHGALFDLSNGELTPTQLDVALLGVEGQTRNQIASELGMAASTVARHVSQVLAKCGLKGQRLTALRRAVDRASHR